MKKKELAQPAPATQAGIAHLLSTTGLHVPKAITKVEDAEMRTAIPEAVVILLGDPDYPDFRVYAQDVPETKELVDRAYATAREHAQAYLGAQDIWIKLNDQWQSRLERDRSELSGGKSWYHPDLDVRVSLLADILFVECKGHLAKTMPVVDEVAATGAPFCQHDLRHRI